MTVATAALKHVLSHSEKENADLACFTQPLPKHVRIAVRQLSETPQLRRMNHATLQYLTVCHKLIH
jgi:hypothetical protein